GGRSSSRWPSREIEPSESVSNPAMQRSVVVLPQPLGPRSEKNSPSITSNDSGPTTTRGENPLMSPRTSSPTLPPATGLSQHLFVPARQVGGAVLVHLLVVERHHVLEVVLLHRIVGHLGRELGLPVGWRVAKAPRHLELELGIEGDVDELLGLPL